MKKLLIILSIFLLSIVNVSALVLTVDIPEKYAKVSAGERFYFTVAVKYPENPKRIDLRLNYEVRNENEELVAQTKVLRAVETQASFIDSIVLPEDVGSGFHTINVLVNDYGDMNEHIISSFHITGKGTDKITTYFYIIMTSVGFLTVLVLYDLFRRK